MKVIKTAQYDHKARVIVDPAKINYILNEVSTLLNSKMADAKREIDYKLMEVRSYLDEVGIMDPTQLDSIHPPQPETAT